MSLGAALLAAVRRPPEAPTADPALDRAARDLWDRARGAWPGVDLSAELFLSYVAERLPATADLVPALDALFAGDLYLACACAQRDPAALSAFERSFMSRIEAFLAREDALPSFTDEVKQTLRTRLLVADGQLLPRISQYTGRGPLGAWLWMTTTRVALDLRRAQPPRSDRDPEAALAERTVTPDPELAYLKSRYAPEFRAAFREALGALPDRDGALMRLHYLEGMTTDQIGAIYGVSRWTAGRWVAAICRRVLHQTRRTMADRLNLPPAQLESLMRLVRSELAITVGAVLAPK